MWTNFTYKWPNVFIYIATGDELLLFLKDATEAPTHVRHVQIFVMIELLSLHSDIMLFCGAFKLLVTHLSCDSG